MTIAESLKVRREAAGLSKNELSRLAGLSRWPVTAIELGHTLDPQISTVQMIAKALGCTMDELVTGAGIEKQAGGAKRNQ